MDDSSGDEYSNHWEMQDGKLTRTAPVGLRGGPSLRSVVTVFAQRAGPGGFTARLNGERHECTSVEELLERMPFRLTALELRSLEQGLVIQLDAVGGGHTSVESPSDDSYPQPGSLRRLVALIEAHKRRFGPSLIFTRSSWGWLSRQGPTLI
ncbi:MAG: hypothetical protein ACOH10_14020 [Rhodoglobus sp.]